MKRILFLDDDARRRKEFNHFCVENALGVVSVSLTAVGAMTCLDDMARLGDVFALACLDHDLSGGAFEPSDHRSGYAVARYIALMPPELRPQRIILHSRNEKGVVNMGCSLPLALRAPFGTAEFWAAVTKATH